MARRASLRLKQYVEIQTWTALGLAGWCILRPRIAGRNEYGSGPANVTSLRHGENLEKRVPGSSSFYLDICSPGFIADEFPAKALIRIQQSLVMNPGIENHQQALLDLRRGSGSRERGHRNVGPGKISYRDQ
jgi:hypothetical protein